MIETRKPDLIKQKNKLEKHIGEYLKNHEVKQIKGKYSKLYTGKLSQACKECVNGNVTQLLIDRSCTRKCFFCPHDRTLTHEIIPIMDVARLFSIKDYIDYLKEFKFKGVGFSGGEPLLAFDRLIPYISETRKAFGKKMPLWLYTNGDLITEERLKQLKEAGLDEIRFDLAARNYDFKPVKLARKYIKYVTVETPVIPEDYRTLIKSLKEMKKIGVDYVNLHKLLATNFNKKAFAKRGYALSNPHIDVSKPLPWVIASEIALLKLFKYVTDNDLQMNINFCPFQHQWTNRRYAERVTDTYESINPINMIRRFEIENPSKALIGYLTNKDKKKWKKENKSLYVSEDLINEIIPLIGKTARIYIRHYATSIKTVSPSAKIQGINVKINDKLSINIKKTLLTKLEINGADGLEIFNLLFIKRIPLNMVIKKRIKTTDLNTYSHKLKTLIDFYYRFTNLEFVNISFV